MGSKTDSVVKLAIVFFISLLSFSVGTFVGKKYSDNQHQLAALEPQEGKARGEREVASVDDHGEGKKDAAMTDEEIAKLAQEFVADETTTEKSASGHGEEKADSHEEDLTEDHDNATAENEKAPSPKSKAAATRAEESTHPIKTSSLEKAVSTPEKPAVKAKGSDQSERVPSSLPKNVAQYAVGKFTVQIASYADEAEAQKTASELKDKGYSAFYVPASINGKTWYRVSVGQFVTQKEAQGYRNEFIRSSKVTSAIVQKISQ
jgi:cell division septation protein DedD